MTKDQKVMAFAMLMDGNSVEDIAKRFCVSCKEIRELFNLRETRVGMAANSCIYTGVSEWMRENNIGFSALASMTDTERGVLRNSLIGHSEIKKSLIDKILAVTGLTYEKAFKE